jgi:hypothetical protein
MAKKKKSPAQKRKAAIVRRDKAKARGDTKAALKAGAAARKQGDIMRKASGRVRGEGTRYIGPTGGTTDFESPEAIEARRIRGLGGPTAYQDVNLAGMAAMEGATTAQKRQAFKDLWGEPGSKKYRDMQAWQARQMASAPVVVPDTETTDESLSLLGGDNVGNVITGLYDNPVIQQQKYLSPAAQDWSDYMPAEGLLQSPAQQRLAAQGGLLYQPGSRPVQSRYVGALSEYNLPQGLGTHQVSYMGLPKFGTTDTGTTDTGTTDTGTTDTGTTDDVYIPPPGGGNGGNGGNGGDTTDYTDYGYDVVADNMTDWVGTTGPEPDYGDVFIPQGNPHLASTAFTHTPVIPDISGLLDTQSPLLYSYDPNVSASYSGMLDDFSVDDFIDTTTTSVNPHF